jgi:hypothetical protein
LLYFVTKKVVGVFVHFRAPLQKEKWKSDSRENECREPSDTPRSKNRVGRGGGASCGTVYVRPVFGSFTKVVLDRIELTKRAIRDLIDQVPHVEDRPLQ